MVMAKATPPAMDVSIATDNHMNAYTITRTTQAAARFSEWGGILLGGAKSNGKGNGYHFGGGLGFGNGIGDGYGDGDGYNNGYCNGNGHGNGKDFRYK